MALYVYKKKVPHPHKALINKVSYLAIILGSAALFFSFYPILSYTIYSHFFLTQGIPHPVPGDSGVSSIEKAAGNVANDAIFSTNLVDFTKAASWFPTMEVQAAERKEFSVQEYTLSIPKLKIDTARVLVGGEDLLSGLVQFQPKVLPCEYGKVTILGHSTNPALAHFDGPRRYSSIFTYLPTLSPGDKISVKVGDYGCEYEVFEKFEISPDEVSVLAQQYDQPYLSLITCTPPGTTLRRLVVNARLVDLSTVKQ